MGDHRRGLEQIRAEDLSRSRHRPPFGSSISDSRSTFGSSPFSFGSSSSSLGSSLSESASRTSAFTAFGAQSPTDFSRNSVQTGGSAFGSPFAAPYSGSGSSSSSLYSTPGSPGSSWQGSCPGSPHYDRISRRSQDHQSWRSRDADRDLVPRFSGMSLGDLMKVTVMKEMTRLNMSNNKALDLSKKT